MTVLTSSRTTTAPPVPRPRRAEPDVPRVAETATTPELPPAQCPWPDPWRFSAGARPRTEYWDVATASWHSRGPRRD